MWFLGDGLFWSSHKNPCYTDWGHVDIVGYPKVDPTVDCVFMRGNINRITSMLLWLKHLI